MKRCVRPDEYLPLVVLSIAFLALPLLTVAQDVPPPALGQPIAAPPSNTVNCFDYYSFGSVQVDVTASVQSAVSGTPVSFVGKLKNANPYPVVGGSVYVKIFKDRGDGSKDANGPDVVDQFYALEDISIPANGEKPIEITWNVPSYAVSGSYKLATFFTAAKKFNLLGLPFTDDVVGNTAPFRVTGEQKASVAFKKDAVTVDGNQYYFAAFPPRADAAKPVTIEATLINTGTQSVTIPLTWTLYHWAQNDQANYLDRRVDEVTIPPGGEKKVSFIVNDAQYPVYLLEGVARWKDTSSIINVRFVRSGHDRLRINYPALMSYPLTKGEESTLFSCLHNAGESASVPNGRLELSLLDHKGKVIHSYTYTGNVTGAMMGVAEKFIPQKTYGTFTLDAKLYQGEELVDQSSVTYNCQVLDPSLCPTESADPATTTFIFGGIAALVALAGLAFAVNRMRARRSSTWVEKARSKENIL